MKRHRREIYVEEKCIYTYIEGLRKVNLKLYLLFISA